MARVTARDNVSAGLTARRISRRSFQDRWVVRDAAPGRRPRPRAREEIAQAGRAFSREFIAMQQPPWLRTRTDPWAVADRVAWNEDALPTTAPQWLRNIADRRTPTTLRSGVVHGDLTGNVLFHEDLPPAVIDLSVYFRPVEYAMAIIATDAVCFEGASPAVRGVVAADIDQMIIRAVLFRAITDLLRTGSVSQVHYDPAIALLDPSR